MNDFDAGRRPCSGAGRRPCRGNTAVRARIHQPRHNAALEVAAEVHDGLDPVLLQEVRSAGSIEAEGLAPPEYPASSQGTQIEHSHGDLLDLTLEIGHRVQDLVGPEREGHDFLALGDAAQHQDRMQACFHAGNNVRVHAIADHCSGL